MSKLYRASIILGLLPLFTGILVFILRYFIRMDFFIIAGIFTIAGGLISISIAAICLIVFLFKEKKNGKYPKAILKKGLLSGGLIVANILLAFLIIIGVIVSIDTNILIIRNNSSTAISEIVITAPGVDICVGPIFPNKKISRRFEIQGDGALQFSASQNDFEFNGTIAGYVSGGLGDKYILTIKDDKEFEVIEQ